MAKHLLAVLLLLELHRPLLQLGGPIIVTTGLGGPSKRLVAPPFHIKVHQVKKLTLFKTVCEVEFIFTRESG